jgi:hypothetical protein
MHDTCAECGHVFTPGELRYRSDDGRDYCTPNGCGQRRWAAETG